MFSPVIKASYKVENSRVGQVTDFDKLIFDFIITGPASSFDTIFIIDIPVSLSKFIIDLCIGAAPLHLGSKEACTFMNFIS